MLAPYRRLNSRQLVVETITHVRYDAYTFIIVTKSGGYLKLQGYNGDGDGLVTERLQAADLKHMGIIDEATWELILAERREKLKVLRQSDTEIAVRRLVKEHGADKIRDLIEDVE